MNPNGIFYLLLIIELLCHHFRYLAETFHIPVSYVMAHSLFWFYFLKNSWIWFCLFT